LSLVGSQSPDPSNYYRNIALLKVKYTDPLPDPAFNPVVYGLLRKGIITADLTTCNGFTKYPNAYSSLGLDLTKERPLRISWAPPSSAEAAVMFDRLIAELISISKESS
jgi:hypothetical protein